MNSGGKEFANISQNQVFANIQNADHVNGFTLVFFILSVLLGSELRPISFKF